MAATEVAVFSAWHRMADYVWYRTIASLLGFATKDLSSDRMLSQGEFSVLLDVLNLAAFGLLPGHSFQRETYPPLLQYCSLYSMQSGEHARLDSLRCGLSICAWKEAKPT